MYFLRSTVALFVDCLYRGVSPSRRFTQFAGYLPGLDALSSYSWAPPRLLSLFLYSSIFCTVWFLLLYNEFYRSRPTFFEKLKGGSGVVTCRGAANRSRHDPSMTHWSLHSGKLLPAVCSRVQQLNWFWTILNRFSNPDYERWHTSW